MVSYGMNKLCHFKKNILRGVFFNTCHLLDYFSYGQLMRMVFIYGESPIFSDQIGVKVIADLRMVM